MVSCPRCCRDGAIWFAKLVKKKVSQEEEEERERERERERKREKIKEFCK
jgi:hypothetical protein